MSQIPQALINQLNHHDHNIRKDAVLALINIEDPAKLPLLIQALRSERDPLVREDITYAIARMGAAVVPDLVALLKDDRSDVRNQAAHVLGKLRQRSAVEPLVMALYDPDSAVVAKAAFALYQIGDAAAVPALVSLLGHNDADVQTMLITVLSHFGSDAVSALVRAAESERWQVREQVVEILGAIGDAAAVPTLLKALHDAEWQVRFASLMALNEIDSTETRPALREMIDDPDSRVQGLARQLLRDG